MRSFKRGIKLADRKELTAKLSIEVMPRPKKVILPVQQHLGCPGQPLVKVGDQVLEGQKIAEADKTIFAPIHATISGTVTKIARLPNVCDYDVLSIVIESSEPAMVATEYSGQWTVAEFTPEQIRKAVREAGIVGLGGAGFPTQVKLNPPAGKKIETVIINGCECEPFITADQRLMLEQPEKIVLGAEAIAKAVGAKRIILAIEENKGQGIKGIETIKLKTKYPQGGEKLLIKAVLGREVPSGGLPHDVGVVVQNVGTAVAIADAIRFGKPLMERVVTVTGSAVKEPKNLLVRIGTTFGEVLAACGGLTDDVAKVIMGGPMTGIAVSSPDVPVVKTTNCILALSKKEATAYQEDNCIRCGCCIKSCPIGLLPNFMAESVKLSNWDRLERYHVADCIECGCCAYVCPSKIYLVQYFKLGKQQLQTRKAICK
jgi:electron transport complex protein RnfC